MRLQLQFTYLSIWKYSHECAILAKQGNVIPHMHCLWLYTEVEGKSAYMYSSTDERETDFMNGALPTN